MMAIELKASAADEKSSSCAISSSDRVLQSLFLSPLSLATKPPMILDRRRRAGALGVGFGNEGGASITLLSSSPLPKQEAAVKTTLRALIWTALAQAGELEAAATCSVVAGPCSSESAVCTTSDITPIGRARSCQTRRRPLGLCV